MMNNRGLLGGKNIRGKKSVQLFQLEERDGRLSKDTKRLE